MKKLYALALSAKATDAQWIRVIAGYTEAYSNEEARGIGITLAEQEMPSPEFHSHSCAILEIPEKVAKKDR